MKPFLIIICSVLFYACHKIDNRLNIGIENVCRNCPSLPVKFEINDSLIFDDNFKYSNIRPNYQFFNLTVKQATYKYRITIKDSIIEDTINIVSPTTFLIIGYNEFQEPYGLKKVIGIDKIHQDIVLQ
jgi:hypothetical protein